MVPEISVHSHLAPLFQDLRHGRTSQWKACDEGNLMAAKKQKEEGLKSQYTLQGHNPITQFLSTRPHLKVPPFSNSTTGWQLSLQHIGLWGTSTIQAITLY